MAGVIEERYGVSVSGAAWDSGNFKLWASQSPGVILFSPRQPMLARNLTTGRYEAACSQYRAQAEGTYKIVGGASSFTVTTGLQYDEQQIQALKEQWRTTLGSDPTAPKDPTFVPLNTRKGTTQLAIPTVSGAPSKLTQDANDAGTPGGTLTYMCDLTAIGAQEWGDAIRSGKSPVAQIMLQYEYLRYMPTCSVEIDIDGQRCFQHFSGQLKASFDGVYYGGSVDIQAQFESLRADGSIVMRFVGLDDLPGGMEKIKENVIQTVTDQGLKAMLGMLFQPKPDVKPAQAGSSGGIFGGANLALKWQRSEEAVNLHTKLEFGGFTWLTERADLSLDMFAVLDDSYVNTVNTELQFPATITVVGDPSVSAAAVSWTASEGQAPQSPVFGNQGGTQTYVVTSKTPDDVTISYTAKIDYSVPQWPIVTTQGSGTVKAGFGNTLVKPGAWVGSTSIYLYVEDVATKGIKLIDGSSSTGDYLVVNVSYSAPNLAQPLKASSRLSLDTPVTFSYPLDPQGRPGTATFSAFGNVGGKLTFCKEQPISLDESAVFVLVNDTGVRLVSGGAVLGEDDETAKNLLARRDNVTVSGAGGPASETTKGGPASGRHVHGTLVAVEYDTDGAAVWVTSNGQRVRFPLQSGRLASAISEKEQVDLSLDASGAVSQITVELV
jgi:hypothetical protein